MTPSDHLEDVLTQEASIEFVQKVSAPGGGSKVVVVSREPKAGCKLYADDPSPEDLVAGRTVSMTATVALLPEYASRFTIGSKVVVEGVKYESISGRLVEEGDALAYYRLRRVI